MLFVITAYAIMIFFIFQAISQNNIQSISIILVEVHSLFSKLPIRKQMFFIASLTIAAFIGLLLFNYYQTANMVTKKNETSTNDIFMQIKQTVGGNYDVVKWLTYNIGYNRTVQDLLFADATSLPNKKMETYQQINNLLFNLTTVNPGILDLVVMGSNGARISLNSGVRDIESFVSPLPEDKEPVYSEMKECFAGRQVKGNCLIAGTTIYSNVIYDRYTQKIGSIYIMIDPSMLVGGRLGANQEGVTTSLLDRNNQVIVSTDEKMIGQPFKTDAFHQDKMHIQLGVLPEIDGYVVRYIPDNVFYKDVRLLRRWSLIGILVGLSMLSIPFFLILHNVISPLRALYMDMRIRKPDDLNKAIKLRGSTEAESIAKQFNQMMRQLKELTGELLESRGKLLNAEIEMKRAEYAYLKSQVNPHFLYNTLDAIRGIALDREVPEINLMTKALSQIFRYSVKGNDFVTVREELEIIAAYMHIQGIRFAGRFELRLNVEERYLNCRVPKMILQPIIENAVYHGLEPRSRPGLLTVTAYESVGRVLSIRISDNGEGMTDKELQQLRDRLIDLNSAGSRHDEAGIGLRNVQNRLRLIYGEPFGLHIESVKSEGTEVEMKLPIQLRGEQ
jgi:two-component system sensor histidine kinase YesM